MNSLLTLMVLVSLVFFTVVCDRQEQPATIEEEAVTAAQPVDDSLEDMEQAVDEALEQNGFPDALLDEVTEQIENLKENAQEAGESLKDGTAAEES